MAVSGLQGFNTPNTIMNPSLVGNSSTSGALTPFDAFPALPPASDFFQTAPSLSNQATTSLEASKPATLPQSLISPSPVPQITQAIAAAPSMNSPLNTPATPLLSRNPLPYSMTSLPANSVNPYTIGMSPMANMPSGMMAMNPFMMYGNMPQIAFVPVLQSPPTPTDGETLKPASPPSNTPVSTSTTSKRALQNPLTDDSLEPLPETTSAESEALESESSDPWASELESDDSGLPTPHQVGQKIGNTIEHILDKNPELLDDVDRLNLDDPDALINQVHDTFHPLIKWVPDVILNKMTAAMPYEWQNMGGRLLNWLNTPTEQLQPLSVASRSASRNTYSASHHSSSSLSGSRQKTPHKHPDPFAEEDSSSSFFDEPKKGLINRLNERLNPLSHLPGFHKKSDFDFDY